MWWKFITMSASEPFNVVLTLLERNLGLHPRKLNFDLHRHVERCRRGVFLSGWDSHARALDPNRSDIRNTPVTVEEDGGRRGGIDAIDIKCSRLFVMDVHRHYVCGTARRGGDVVAMVVLSPEFITKRNSAKLTGRVLFFFFFFSSFASSLAWSDTFLWILQSFECLPDVLPVLHRLINLSRSPLNRMRFQGLYV